MAEDLWTIAQRVCTSGELAAWRLEQAGQSQRAIAVALGVSRTTIRDRLENAARKIRLELAAHQDENARP